MFRFPAFLLSCLSHWSTLIYPGQYRIQSTKIGLHLLTPAFISSRDQSGLEACPLNARPTQATQLSSALLSASTYFRSSASADDGVVDWLGSLTYVLLNTAVGPDDHGCIADLLACCFALVTGRP